MEDVQFRSIVEQLPLVVYVDELDERSSALYVSPLIERLLGYTAEEWLADPDLFVRCLHPDDRERVLADIARRNESGNSTPVSDYRLIARDRSIVWVCDDEVVVRDADGKPRYAQGYLQDVTERHESSTRLELLVGILSAAVDGLSPDEAVRAAVDRLAAFFPDVRVSFCTLTARRHLQPEYSTLHSTLPPASGEPLDLDDEYLWLLGQGQAVAVEDVRSEIRFRRLVGRLAAGGVGAFLDVPLRRDGRLAAVLCFDAHSPRTWTRYELNALGEVADQLAVILSGATARAERERVERDLRRRDAILEAVSRSAERLLLEPTWREAAPSVLEELGTAVGASRAYLFENGVAPDGAVVTSQRAEWVAAGIKPELDNPILQMMRFADVGLDRFEELVGRDEVFAANVRDLPSGERVVFEAQSVRSVMTVPVFVEGCWWGFVGFDDCVAEREWTPAETDALRTAASLVAAAIRRERSEAVLREHEQKLRAVFETALDAIFITNDAREYVDANPAACDLLGVAKRDLLGRRIDDFAPAERLQTLDADWTAYISGGPTMSESRIRRANGEHREIDVSARPQFLPGLNIAFARDVTDRKRLENELLNAQKLESIGRLAGGVAHDFNNLLTAIGGYTSLLLQRANGDAALAHDLGEIRRATERAGELTHQLLAFGRRQVLQPRVFDLNDVLTNVGSLLQRLLGEHVELELERASGPATVRADPGQLEQVIVNLAVNARDAMPDGGRLQISIRDVELPEGPFVELRATDTGVGMDAETLGRIFEPFFTTREQGVGLGLASVYGIVRQSGGDVVAVSEPGTGTTFTVRLPRIDEEPAAAAATVAPVAETQTGTETILLVEDEDVVRALTQRVLERCGYTVLSCANGADAVELATGHAEPIHLLLTDVVMPGLRGHEVAEQVVSSRPGIKVLYMSGYADEALLGAAAIAGPALIEKPFAVDTLARRVREALEAASDTIPATRA
ncbi:MAG TPA: PAS domain S-box protein [Gaiellaceae bacterium]|nr:PAS domain S-box protein [Gaiellaceae bacterium]